MKLKEPIKIYFVQILIIFCFINAEAQTNYNLDSTWDNYYNSNPSGIAQNFQSSDFINVINRVNFIPKRRELNGNQNLLIRAILMLEFDDLRQMSITGNYYSRTKKHDDYFMLYNMTYEPISKDTWNRLCPYLLPIMDIDGTLNLK
jgi:hypothetical protein